ncbi:hypothetical protein M0R04_01125 [Candidatus Dojkabacteria bacterium]|jgi:hypothetical protein|nr:hypothetical protein [Candidatus Dojkabacteria bacterium]
MELPVFTVIEGKKNILISAPHVFPHKRPRLTGVLKQGEEYLDEMIKNICKKTGAWGIYLSQNTPDYDPNFNGLESNPYKQKVKEIIEDNKIEYFIDFHGLSESHCYDFGISFCMRFQRSKNLGLKLLNEFKKNKELYMFNAKVGYIGRSEHETLTEYACLTKRIPAFQIEIAKYIRKDPYLRALLEETVSSFIQNITT